MTHTVTIDQRYYESAMAYAKLHDISMTSVVEQGLSLLFNQYKTKKRIQIYSQTHRLGSCYVLVLYQDIISPRR